MNILITGITGFVGSFLAEELFQNDLTNKNLKVFGTSFSSGLDINSAVTKKINILKGNLRDSSFVQKIIKESKPDVIYHLAALSSGRNATDSASPTILNNLEVQLNIFEEVRKQKLNPKILIIGSAQEYGVTPKSVSYIDETVALNPVSPYGFSKVAQDLSAYTYFKSFGLKIIRIRAFNHTGPRQTEEFVIPSFAKQIIEKSKTKDENEKIISVGNLDVTRDFTDVRDIVKAYILAVEKCKVGDVYNLGSGKGYKVRWLLDKLIQFSGENIKIEIDKKKLRAVDNPVTICNYGKFHKDTKWKPQIPIEKTLEDIFNYWKGKQ
ncbi:hypothetical protein A2X44_01285 [candidate division CPR3 bacterium GWF2_35_18]|uniref:NAD-dependent epimerase/dehydratase n=1 Tax=candidate division CPR3 bacterium GW2011_GWF2_35_18 TaxID=1618350 RepID=A0A0G0ESQ4_UNCC3|nr:MAG: NAD-dependent epimerase/dehydratase [candidate division CPR3 bacterium GW2011_GWF2_35_18]OGB63535.1 MAG: hypothetical protein A2X44_01285 [candidate division CPR3 bacterium GWF2_35_18]OGB64644.1 MAG: hypothetical protein A2250_03835 [candidate division CPR3 bacterium RIFOXYA2_FULL_35_13]OGB78755.1 MAG: hypothetical protein A2296_00080 [candidate division CPR3 bacterium RIFOXYB2_FULL_35_8]